MKNKYFRKAFFNNFLLFLLGVLQVLLLLKLPMNFLLERLLNYSAAGCLLIGFLKVFILCGDYYVRCILKRRFTKGDLNAKTVALYNMPRNLRRTYLRFCTPEELEEVLRFFQKYARYQNPGVAEIFRKDIMQYLEKKTKVA